MLLGLTVLLFTVASYFLAAAIVPRIRVRWGTSVGASITSSREGVERSKFKNSKPRMGAFTCLGFATFLGGFAMGVVAPRTPVPYVVAAGLALMAVGAVLDWLHEPPTYTKR